MTDVCYNCKKSFFSKSSLKRHLNRKTPCLTIDIPEEVINEDEPLKFIDLFCGIGSFHHSFKKLGWECVMSSDIDKTVCDTYEENYKIKPMGDITKIEPNDVPDYDILCAGFPCQSFSQCGYHKGFEDERGNMIFSILKLIKHQKPKFLVLENVQALLNHDKGNSFRRIKEEISNAGYSMVYKILKCSDYGIPQMRKRLFIIGIRNDLECIENIEKLFDLKEYEKDCSMSEYLGKNFLKKHAYTVRCGGKNSKINDRHNWDGYIVNEDQEYRLTIDDCLKLQGFSESFILKGNNKDKWKQLGNTIPTIFTEIIGKQIKKYLL